MKVIIAGGRDFKDHCLMYSKCDKILSSINEEIEIVTGGQVSYDRSTNFTYGADYIGYLYSLHKGYKHNEFKANWDQYGKAAGPIRNEEMAKYADALIAFWDGVSRGTKSMIELAKKHGLKIRVINY